MTPASRRRRLGGLATAVVAFVAVTGWLLTRGEAPSGDQASAATPPTVTASPTGPRPSAASSGSAASAGSVVPSTPMPAGVAAELERMRTAPAVAPAGPSARVTGEATTQPDLYAAEFVRRLLTQDHRTPRTAHLGWVQAESAQTSEPLVIGLVPLELRGRLAVYSVTDSTDGPAPVPTQQEWEALAAQGGSQTAQIDRVGIPLAWSNAVAAGRITDPGITGREVLATVTRHTGASVTRWSVAIALNLQGPPTRATWGFVTAVTYRAVQVGVS
ncbi:MAG TPA: hypothetical protein P5544_06365 [Candidatus Nanopelagicales bacterium]|nr:hypothetical protein [Candidatus Nanopelagicales bacterium]